MPYHTNPDVELLLKLGVLGFYNHVEVIEIFSIDPEKNVSNLLTLMIAQESSLPLNLTEKNLTLKPIEVTTLKKWRFGIKKYDLSINDLKSRLNRLNSTSVWDERQKIIKYLEKKDKVFISPDSFESVPLNNILKNNFHNGSYLIEWFDKGKENHIEILSNPINLNNISNEIKKIIPISLSPVSDRVGNFILQIPPRILMSDFGLTNINDEYMLNCKIAWHAKAKSRDLIINCHLRELDRSCEGYYTKIMKKNKCELTFPISNKRDHVGTVWDPVNNLILSRTRPSAFFSPSARISVSTSIQKERLLPTPNGMKKVGILVSDKRERDNSDSQILNWTEQRIYDNDSKTLKENREFVQYNPRIAEKTKSKKNAISDLLYLINQHGKRGVWLWDPYLSYEDVFNTLLCNPHVNSQMKAISSLETPPTCDICTPKAQYPATNVSSILEHYKKDFIKLPDETKKQ